MINGLVEVAAAPARRSRRLRTPLVVTATVAVAAFAATAGLALTAPQAEPTVPDPELVTRLAGLEQELAGVPLLADVQVFPDRTWGQISGDFVGSEVILEQADASLADLVADASDSDTPVADAVETVAGSYRTLHRAYGYLAAFEQAAIGAAPAEGDEGPAPADGTTDPRGHAQIGLSLQLAALDGLGAGYAVLRDVDVAGEHRALFEQRYTAVQTVAQDGALDVRVALAAPVTDLIVATDRFTPAEGQNPAQVARYTCVDRDGYLEARNAAAPQAPDAAGQASAPSAPTGDAGLPIPDCPNLDNGNEVTVVTPAS